MLKMQQFLWIIQLGKKTGRYSPGLFLFFYFNIPLVLDSFPSTWAGFRFRR